MSATFIHSSIGIFEKEKLYKEIALSAYSGIGFFKAIILLLTLHTGSHWDRLVQKVKKWIHDVWQKFIIFGIFGSSSIKIDTFSAIAMISMHGIKP